MKIIPIIARIIEQHRDEIDNMNFMHAFWDALCEAGLKGLLKLKEKIETAVDCSREFEDFMNRIQVVCREGNLAVLRLN